MVRYLIQRPVAVIISFIAIMVIGLIVAGLLPISLLPDIKVPEITVYVSQPNTSATDLERSIVAGMRTQLMQLPGLEDIQSETRDNKSIIRLLFDYGTNIDLAFIEVNDKVDAALSLFPREVRRPKIIKASATDIPVFLLNISLSDSVKFHPEEKFNELGGFTETVIRKRLEQLPSVAYADISGTTLSELYIVPDQGKIQSLGLSPDALSSALLQNNISVSGIIVREGLLQYSLMFKNELRTVDEVKNILVEVNGVPVSMKYLAKVGMRQQPIQGLYMSQGREAICLALIKSSDARINTMRYEVNELIGQLKTAYPEINIETSQDQSFLLTYTIDNLRSNLLQGCFLAILVMFLFIRNYRSPLLIALTLPVTLVFSLFLFYLFGISINIVSLSGLILGIGMMVDNSIVVIDNIIQHQQRGTSFIQAIVSGTNEVITPMISSTLTSCAVFIPLIFLSGIAGALFYDQAIAIAIGQGISLLVSVTLTPTLYHLIHKKEHKHTEIAFLKNIKLFDLEKSYVRGFDYIFRNQTATFVVLALVMIAGFLAFTDIDKRQLPVLPQNETIVNIDWNENIHIDENKRRIAEMLRKAGNTIVQSNAFIGEQQFVLNHDLDLSTYESQLYLKVRTNTELIPLQNRLTAYIQRYYPLASLNFSPPENPFMKIFSGKESNLTARIRSGSSDELPPIQEMQNLSKEINLKIKDAQSSIPVRQQYIIHTKPELLILYNIDYQSIVSVLQTAFNSNYIGNLKADDRFVPIVMGAEPAAMNEVIAETFIASRKGDKIPLKTLVSIEKNEGYRTIYGGREGAFVPLSLDVKSNDTPNAMETIKALAEKHSNLEVGFSGSYFKNQKLMGEMGIIMLISVLLLFFILAAQFESISIPWVVLIEIPIDLAFAVLFLYVAGNSINAMSLIGFIVMSGIIINDSILKIDTVNQLRKEGFSVMEAIHEGGRRRIKPIIMTALVTVIALLPQMLGSDIGAKLQLPLSISMLGGMTAGTLVSLWIIPLLYYHTVSAGSWIKTLFHKNTSVSNT